MVRFLENGEKERKRDGGVGDEGAMRG